MQAGRRSSAIKVVLDAMQRLGVPNRGGDAKPQCLGPFTKEPLTRNGVLGKPPLAPFMKSGVPKVISAVPLPVILHDVSRDPALEGLRSVKFAWSIAPVLGRLRSGAICGPNFCR